jgi:hypothetical protein
LPIETIDFKIPEYFDESNAADSERIKETETQCSPIQLKAVEKFRLATYPEAGIYSKVRATTPPAYKTSVKKMNSLRKIFMLWNIILTKYREQKYELQHDYTTIFPKNRKKSVFRPFF